MFAVIYRIDIKVGFEDEYAKYWKKVASYFVENRGAISSTLHKSENGSWLIYSKWPSKNVKEASWPQQQEFFQPDFPEDICSAIQAMKNCLTEEVKLPEIYLEIKETS